MNTSNERPLALSLRETEVESERFRSLCECTEVRICGKASAEAKLIFTLYAYTSSKNKLAVYEKKLPVRDDGSVTFVHEFDPVSLAVYQDAVEFSALVRDEGQSSFSLSFSLAQNEQLAAALQAISAKRKRKKKEPQPLRKVLFVGNSLLLGMEGEFGMCSSASDRDYAYHVSEEIKKTNPTCEFFKLHGSPIEHAESIEAFEDAFGATPNFHTKKPFCESLTEDLDLIILQIMDNVNTEAKTETFRVTAEILLSRIRERCPHATVVWVYGWYHKHAFFPRLLELCDQFDVEQVDLRGCRYRENESTSGSTYRLRSGEVKVVQDNWITHPGDRGMRAIADRIIEVMRDASIIS